MEAGRPQFTALSDVQEVPVREGIRMRPLFGQGAMLNFIELEPSVTTGPHSHPHEQLGYIIRGELILIVDGVEHRLRENDAYTLPPGIEHEGIGGAEGCLVLDVFQPVREDYRELAERARVERGA